MMGLRSGINFWAWFANTMFGMLLTSAIMVLFYKLGKLLPYSDGVLMFLFLAVFSLASTMFW